MTTQKNVLLAGATGLIGSLLLEKLIANPSVGQVMAFSRRALMDNPPPKLTTLPADFGNLGELNLPQKPDVAFCALGTTMKKAGSKQAFRQVDYDFVLDFAQFAHGSGAKVFVLVSAMGADKNSMIFYNQVKGEAETAVASIPFEACHILQPSLLLGDRKDSRLGEDIGKLFNSLFSWAIPKAYRGISGETVANAMGVLGNHPTHAKTGVKRYSSDKIGEIA